MEGWVKAQETISDFIFPGTDSFQGYNLLQQKDTKESAKGKGALECKVHTQPRTASTHLLLSGGTEAKHSSSQELVGTCAELFSAS